MNYAGDAAEQVVRMTLEGSEVAVKLAGTGAKQIAVLLYAILRDQKKTKGRIRLTNMLRSGKELKVFAVKDTDLTRFCAEAKKYGVLYCVLKDKSAADGVTDIMVRAEDASKINRIFERFRLATVEMSSAKGETERSRAEKGTRGAPEKVGAPSVPDTLLQPVKETDKKTPNPAAARTQKSRRSEPILKHKRADAQSISDAREQEYTRPSVRQALSGIREEQRQKAAAAGEPVRAPAPAIRKEQSIRKER